MMERETVLPYPSEVVIKRQILPKDIRVDMGRQLRGREERDCHRKSHGIFVESPGKPGHHFSQGVETGSNEEITLIPINPAVKTPSRPGGPHHCTKPFTRSLHVMDDADAINQIEFILMSKGKTEDILLDKIDIPDIHLPEIIPCRVSGAAKINTGSPF